MARPEHSITVDATSPSGSATEQAVARCSCGWAGRPFVGQEAQRGAEADGQEHLLRAERSSDGYDPRWPADD
jgi:hypothetical protein